jgi:hypothetical protein
MYKKTQKQSSSLSPIFAQKKTNGFESSRSFSVQPKPDINSSQEQEIPSYSRNAADCLSANVMRSIEEEKDSDEMSLDARVQTKLTVGAVGDKYEQEADRMAAQVMSMSVTPDASPQVQRFGEEDNPVQRWSLAQSITPVVQRQVDEQVQMRQLVQRAFQASGNQASGNLESRLNASKGGGSALTPEVRAFMEPRFGADFSSVRVHTGSEAVQMNQELGAQAFAHGSDVYFGAGKSPGNNELTAHELTHVVQQTGQISTELTVQRFPVLPPGGFPTPRVPVPSDTAQDDDFNFAPLVPSGMKAEDLAALREMYAQGSKAISEEAKLMLSKGVPTEEVANWAAAARNNLKAKIRDEGPKIVKVIAEARNMKKYGNPLGLTAEELRAQGKTNEQIIQSVGKANLNVSKWAGRLRIAGRIMIAIDIGIAAYRVATAPEVDRPKVLIEETGAIAGAIAGAESGAVGGAEIGAWIGGIIGGGATLPVGGEGAIPGAGLGGAIGGLIGGIGGAIGGALVGRKVGSVVAEQLYPPAQTGFEGDFQT